MFDRMACRCRQCRAIDEAAFAAIVASFVRLTPEEMLASHSIKRELSLSHDSAAYAEAAFRAASASAPRER